MSSIFYKNIANFSSNCTDAVPEQRCNTITDTWSNGLAPSCKGADLKEGKRFAANASAAELKSWAEKFLK